MSPALFTFLDWWPSVFTKRQARIFLKKKSGGIVFSLIFSVVRCPLGVTQSDDFFKKKKKKKKKGVTGNENSNRK